MSGKTVGSIISAFVLGFGGSVLVVPLSGYAINKTTFLVGAILGAMSAAKDWRSSNRLPPITTDNLQAMLAAYNVKMGSPVGTAVPPVEPEVK